MNHISKEYHVENILRVRRGILDLVSRKIRYALTPKGEPVDLLEKLYARFYELTITLPPWKVEEIIKTNAKQ